MRDYEDMARLPENTKIIDGRTGRDVLEPAGRWEPVDFDVQLEGDSTGKRMTLTLKFTDLPDTGDYYRESMKTLRRMMGPALVAVLRDLVGEEGSPATTG